MFPRAISTRLEKTLIKKKTREPKKWRLANGGKKRERGGASIQNTKGTVLDLKTSKWARTECWKMEGTYPIHGAYLFQYSSKIIKIVKSSTWSMQTFSWPFREMQGPDDTTLDLAIIIHVCNPQILIDFFFLSLLSQHGTRQTAHNDSFHLMLYFFSGSNCEDMNFLR